jgi:4-hydroxybenzoate polyprenyltransferase
MRDDNRATASYEASGMNDSSSPAGPAKGQGFTDIRAGSWLERQLPAGAMPYARLARWDRPIGWWLLLLPCWWSNALAAEHLPDIGLMILYWIGAVAMRGAGCTLNDIVDRKIDAAVERTRVRPIPAGEVSVFQAVLFMAAQLVVGAVVLFSLKPQVLGLGFAVLALIATYPFMKRVTFWPQLFLGLNFNWGALIGWVAVTGHLAAPAIFLYLAGINWTLGYDTIYAHQDKLDDVRIGVKSTALRFGDDSKRWVGGFYLATLACVCIALVSAGAAVIAAIPVVLLAGHFLWQVVFWKMDDPADCLARFKSNRTAGLLIFVACLVARWHG